MPDRRPLSPPPPRRRKKVGFVDVDSEESGWQLPRPAVDRGLETGAAAAAGGFDKIGAASHGPGRSTASGTSSSYEMVDMVEGTPYDAVQSSPGEPERDQQHAGQVRGDVVREGGDHDQNNGWYWTADSWWDSHGPSTTSWYTRGHGAWASMDWSSRRWPSAPWPSSWTWDWRDWSQASWPETTVLQPVDRLTEPRPDSGLPPASFHHADPPVDQVSDWWNSDGKVDESLEAATCPTGAWEHYKMNGASDEEQVSRDKEESSQSTEQTKGKTRIPSSYPASFAAQSTESYKEWKRAVQMWIAGEGGMLPCEVIGPRVLSVLKGRASILTRKLTVDEVSRPEGLALIFSTLESSSLVQELSGQRGERAQREFLQCKRAPHESLDSFLMRVEAQRDLMLEEDAEFAMGERFLVGYVLDNSELTQRDRVLVMAAAGNKLSTAAVYPALRRMGPFLQGTVPIGRGLSDRPLLPELQPDAPHGSAAQSQGASSHGRGRFGRAYGAHVMEEETGGDDIVPEEGAGDLEEPANGDDEMSVAEHEAFVAVQQGQARLKAIRQARGYYRRTEQSAGGDTAAKKRLEELMAKNPCRNCGGFGHWSRDAICPKNQAKAATSANVTVTDRGTPPAVPVSEALTAVSTPAKNLAPSASGSSATPSHAALTAVLESYLSRQNPASHVASAYMVSADGGEGTLPEAVFDMHMQADTLLAHPPKNTDYEGVMIVDIGCVRSVAGVAWVEREIAIRQRLNKHVHVERAADWFRFGDGVRRLSQYRVFLEIAIKGHTGLLAVNVIDYPCPPLLSKAVCTSLGMCIDCESNSCEIRRLGERRCALCVSTEGHYLIRINDFYPRNPSWHVLVHEQSKRPKVECDEVCMFEIRQGTAVGKGSKSRLRRQARAALSDLAEPNHGLSSKPGSNQLRVSSGSGGLSGTCHSLGSGVPRVRSQLCPFGGGSRESVSGLDESGGGCTVAGERGRCLHDFDRSSAQDASQPCHDAQGQAEVRHSPAAQGDSGRGVGDSCQGNQAQNQSRYEGGHDGRACRFSSPGADQVLGSSDELLLDHPSANSCAQVEGVPAAAAHEASHGEVPGHLETSAGLASTAVRHRVGSSVGALRVMCQDPPPTKGSHHVPLGDQGHVRSLQRGQTQLLKKGVQHAQKGQSLLKEAAGAPSERKFCLLEIFGTSVSLFASSTDWIALEPVDLLCGCDINSKHEQDRVLQQLDAMSPDLVLICPPCGPWSSLQAINDQAVVVWKRLMSYHLWEFTRKVWDLQTAKGGLCLTEQPWLSKALELQVMTRRPHLHRAIIDQCAFKLQDPENKKPMRKRTVLDCNSARFAAFLEEGAHCTHARTDHQVIEGATCVNGHWVNRSLIAGMWTKELCHHILHAAEQTLLSESHPKLERAVVLTTMDDPDLPPEESSCIRCAADPHACCIYCTSVLCSTCASQHTCRLLWDGHEPFDDPCDSHLTCAVEADTPVEQVAGDPEDLAEHAIRREFKRLQEEEDQRKGDFGGIGSRYGYVRFVGASIRLPREVRNQLAKLHGHFGHPSNERLARMLQINGAHKAVIEGAKSLRCSICERISGPRSAPQASSKAPSRFNEQCVLDSFFILDSLGQRWNVTHMLDGFCSLQYGICSKNPSSTVSAELLFDRWIMHHGPPAELCVDGGSEFRGAFETMCRVFDIRLTILPTAAKFKAGLSERHGAILKLMVLRSVHELSVSKESELKLTVAMCCQAKNRLLRKCGRSPLQVVQGRDVVVPSALVQQIADGEIKMSSNHEVTHDEEVNRMEQIRCASMSAFQWLDSHERLRIALNSRSRPPKLVSLTPGTTVYFHKPPGQHRRLQDNATGQQGPAIVAATEGVDKVWVRYKGSVVRVALENVRLATPEETVDTRYICDVLSDMQQELTGAVRPSGYEDLTEQPTVTAEDAIVIAPVGGTRPSTEESNSQPVLEGPREPGESSSHAQDETHAVSSDKPTGPVPSNVLPEAEMTPEVLRQLEASRLAANRLDGYRPKQFVNNSPNPNTPQIGATDRSVPSSSDGPRPADVKDVPTSLEEARVKHKVEFFEGGAQSHVWDSIQERLGDWGEVFDSSLKRARLDGDLRAASEAITHSRDLLKRDRKRDLQEPKDSQQVGKLSKRDFAGPSTHVTPVDSMPAFEVCEAGVVPWAPDWARACWALEVTVLATSSVDQEDRIKHEADLRATRFALLEQGFDEEIKNKELETCRLERGHGNGPPPRARNEIYVKDMTAAELRLTIPALVKALSIHFDHEAIKAVPIGRIVPKERVIRSRMVIVNKKQLTQGFEPKGRLCVGGHRDPDLGKYDAASPTALSLAHALLLCIATTLGWAINIADVTAAFLQGLELPRTEPLFVQIPSGCPPEIAEYLKWRLGPDSRSDMFEATKGIFGLSESPLLWYLKFRDTLAGIGFSESKLIPCLFMKHNSRGELVGLVTLHVDDALLAGNAEVAEDWQTLQTQLKFGSWTDLKDGGKFLGRVMRQSDDRHTVTVDMNLYCQSLSEIEVKAALADDEAVSPEQSAQLRALVGQLGWLAKQGRPDLAFAVSHLQQNLIDATGSTLRLANTTVQKAKQETCFYVKGLGCSLQDIMVLVATDGALAAMPRGKSQLGIFLMLANPKVQTEVNAVVPIEWCSTSCKRVVRSSSSRSGSSFVRL